MRINATIFLTFIFVVFSSCGGEHTTKTVNTPTIQCGMCQKTIEIGLKKISGITAATVDLKTKSTTVSFDIDKTDITIIEKTISNLGYQANLTPADPAVYDKLPDCCKLDG